MNSMFSVYPASSFWLERVLGSYEKCHRGDSKAIEVLRAAIAAHDDLFDRSTMPLHVTASALVVDQDKTHILLLLHKRLGIWLQPGGHIEKNETPPQTAVRELFEECRVSAGAIPDDVPLEIDLHHIPSHKQKGEPSHWHADFRYLFFVEIGDLTNSDESYEARWFSLEDATRASEGRLESVLSKLKAGSLPRCCQKQHRE